MDFEAIILCHFFQCPCCCLHSEGSDGNLSLYFFPGSALICFAFDIKQGIVDPREGLPSVLVATAWSKDDMSGGKEEKNVDMLNKIIINGVYVPCRELYVCVWRLHIPPRPQ